MKSGFAVLVLALLVGSGCVSKRGASAFSAPPDSGSVTSAEVPALPAAQPASVRKPVEPEFKLIVTPEDMMVGSVSAYNTAGRFVVLNFPVGKMPTLDQVMFVYRQGLKVGEVKIAGPERDHMTVGDLMAGEARKGDEVRDR